MIWYKAYDKANDLWGFIQASNSIEAAYIAFDQFEKIAIRERGFAKKCDVILEEVIKLGIKTLEEIIKENPHGLREVVLFPQGYKKEIKGAFYFRKR